MSSTKLRVFITIAVIAAAVCVRLGIWQLHRLGERRARNALVASRLDSATVDVAALPRDMAQARFRRVRVAGTPDYAHELVLAARTRQGSPGVNLLTPVRLPGRDTAIIVNRGWVYSPDGATIDLARWHDRDTVFTGYVELMPGTGGSTYASRPGVLSRLTHSALGSAVPYPVADAYLVALDDSVLGARHSALGPSTIPTAESRAPRAERPARLEPPPLDDGPHLSYAIQWFGFALVALVGAAVVVTNARRTGARPQK